MNRIVDIATLAFTVAAITVLVRPNSKGPEFVRSIGDSFANVIKSATAF